MKNTEKVSFYTHAFGVVLALIGTLLLVFSTWGVTSCLVVSLIYGISVIILFLSSSMYHYFKKEDGEYSFWRKLDHFAIFIMIAGTYTPVTYIYLSGYWKWTILILQWSLVLGGFYFKFYYLNAPRYLYTIIYLLMGWVGIIPIKQFIMSMPTDAVAYLLLGGISYTVGALFYMFKYPSIKKGFGFHEIFHIMVIIGSFFHYLLVYGAVTT